MNDYLVSFRKKKNFSCCKLYATPELDKNRMICRRIETP